MAVVWVKLVLELHRSTEDDWLFVAMKIRRRGSCRPGPGIIYSSMSANLNRDLLSILLFSIATYFVKGKRRKICRQ